MLINERGFFILQGITNFEKAFPKPVILHQASNFTKTHGGIKLSCYNLRYMTYTPKVFIMNELLVLIPFNFIEIF